MKRLLQLFALGLSMLLSAPMLHGQTYPTPQALPYSQNFGTSTFTSMPAGTIAWTNTGTTATQSAAEATNPTTSTTTVTAATTVQTSGGSYGYYQASNARYYVQTSSNAGNGANQLVVGVNVGSNTSIKIDYAIELTNINSAGNRTVGFVLQYKRGVAGTWSSANTVAGSEITLTSSMAANSWTHFTFTVTGLTADSNYYFRWATWRGPVSGGSGSSMGGSIDSIVIAPASISTPTVQADSISFTGTAQTQTTVNWTIGDGTKRVVKLNTANSFTAPADGTDPSASTSYSGGEQVIYNGSGTSVTVTNLSANTKYYARVYEYNGIGATTKYLSGTATGNPDSVTTLAYAYAALSDIILDGSFTHPANIAYWQYRDTVLSGTSLEVGRFTIRDGGAAGSDIDDSSTTLNSITFSVTNSTPLLTVGIFDGTTKLAEASGASSLTFSSLTLAAPDNSTKSFSIRASFKSSVTDNTQFQFSITAASAALTGSNFAAANAGGASSSTSGNNNKIVVTASKLRFVQAPTNTIVTQTMSPSVTVEAVDTLNNRDLDQASVVSLASSGTMTGPVSATLASGFGTFGAIVHTATGSALTLTASASGLTNGTSGTFNIMAGLIELVVPKYFGARTTSSANTARTVFGVCIRLDELVPNAHYALKAGLGAVSEGNSSFGAGSFWNDSSKSWVSAGTAINHYFTANASGSTGPLWIYFQPSGNSSRFGGNQTHNIRIGIAVNNGTISSTPSWAGSKQITSLDVAPSALTADSLDDGAFIRGYTDTLMSGKLAYLYNNTAGTGDPLFIAQISNVTAYNTTSQTLLPAAIDSLMGATNTSLKGQYAAVVPARSMAGQGVRRVEIRNTDNTLYAVDTSYNGVWQDTAYTASGTRGSVTHVKWNTKVNLNAAIEALWDGVSHTSDTVVVQLRDPASLTVIDSSIIIIANTAGTARFNYAFIGSSYYFSIRHRNSIRTWSASTRNFLNGAVNYNFTDNASKAYGNNLVLKSGVYCIYSGDVNQDGLVDLNDMLPIDNDNAGFLYTIENDVNMDGLVDLNDMIVVDNNNSGFVGEQIPVGALKPVTRPVLPVKSSDSER